MSVRKIVSLGTALAIAITLGVLILTLRKGTAPPPPPSIVVEKDHMPRADAFLDMEVADIPPPKVRATRAPIHRQQPVATPAVKDAGASQGRTPFKSWPEVEKELLDLLNSAQVSEHERVAFYRALDDHTEMHMGLRRRSMRGENVDPEMDGVASSLREQLLRAFDDGNRATFQSQFDRLYLVRHLLWTLGAKRFFDRNGIGRSRTGTSMPDMAP